MMMKLFFGLLSIFVIAFIISAQQNVEFKEDDIQTWSDNIEEVLKLDPDTRNDLLNKADGNIRGSIIEKMGIEIVRRKVQATVDKQVVASAAARLVGKNPPEFPAGSDTFLESMKGFDSSKIQFKENNILTDGRIELDLDTLPMGVKGLEYIDNTRVETPSQVVYTFHDNSQIAIEGRKLNQDLTYESDSIIGSNSEKGKVTLIPQENGKITMGMFGDISIQGDSQVQIGDRVFGKLDKENQNPARIRVVEGSWFAGKNILAETSQTEIKTSSDKESHIIFKKGDFDLENYIQIFDGEKNKQIVMKGENIEVNLLSLDEGYVYNDFDGQVDITAEGKSLVVKNGEQVLEIDGDKTFVSRKSNEAVVDATITNGAKVGQEVKTQVKEEVVVQTKDQGEKTETSRSNTVTEICSDLGICYMQIGNPTVVRKTGAGEVLKSTSYLEENFWKRLPRGMTRQQFEQAFLGIPTKINVDPLLNLGWAGQRLHNGPYITKEDLVKDFSKKSDGFQENSKIGFTQADRDTLLNILERNLKSSYPPESRIVLETGYNIAEKKSYPIIRTTLPGKTTEIVEIRNPKEIEAFRKFYWNSIFAEDKEMNGYDPKKGIKTPFDQLYNLYRNR